MRPEVQEALYGWLAGIAIGALPLFVHALTHFFYRPNGTPEASWAVDVIFVTISTAGASAVSLIGRPGGVHIVRGRAAPALVALIVLFLVLASTLYGAEVTGSAQKYAINFAWGLLVGAAALSLYFELTIAARFARADAADHGKSGGIQS